MRDFGREEREELTYPCSAHNCALTLLPFLCSFLTTLIRMPKKGHTVRLMLCISMVADWNIHNRASSAAFKSVNSILRSDSYCREGTDRSSAGLEEEVRRPEVGGAYLDTRQCCCRVSARAAGRCTECCTRRRRRNECDSASLHRMWPNTHSTRTTPHLTESLLGQGLGAGQGRTRVSKV